MHGKTKHERSDECKGGRQFDGNTSLSSYMLISEVMDMSCTEEIRTKHEIGMMGCHPKSRMLKILRGSGELQHDT